MRLRFRRVATARGGDNAIAVREKNAVCENSSLFPRRRVYSSFPRHAYNIHATRAFIVAKSKRAIDAGGREGLGLQREMTKSRMAQ